MMNTDHLPARAALTMFGNGFAVGARSRAGVIAALMLGGALCLPGAAMAQSADPGAGAVSSQNPAAGHAIDYAQTLDYTGITMS